MGRRKIQNISINEESDIELNEEQQQTIETFAEIIANIVIREMAKDNSENEIKRKEKDHK